MSYRILVTGSRHWTNESAIEGSLQLALPFESSNGGGVVVVHGDCPTGADAIVQRVCERRGITTECHPADWDTYGKAAGPIRNQHMVNLGADVCLAYPLPGSRGTIHCMKAAEDSGIPVYVVPDADIEVL